MSTKFDGSEKLTPQALKELKDVLQEITYDPMVEILRSSGVSIGKQVVTSIELRKNDDLDTVEKNPLVVYFITECDCGCDAKWVRSFKIKAEGILSKSK